MWSASTRHLAIIILYVLEHYNKYLGTLSHKRIIIFFMTFRFRTSKIYTIKKRSDLELFKFLGTFKFDVSYEFLSKNSVQKYNHFILFINHISRLQKILLSFYHVLSWRMYCLKLLSEANNSNKTLACDSHMLIT